MSSSVAGRLALHKFAPERPPAVLFGGLTLLRPLGVASIPVVVATPDTNRGVLASKYCCGHWLIPESLGPGDLADSMGELGRRLSSTMGRRVPLFYGTDDQLAFLYKHWDFLSNYYTALLNDKELGYDLLYKDRFHQLAEIHGLPVPRTLSWDGADAVSRATGPVIVKPKTKEAWEQSPVFHKLLGEKGKALVFASGKELLAHDAILLLRDYLTVQDYIQGEDKQLYSFHGFADENSDLLAWFVGRKIRTFPRFTGESSFLEMARRDAALVSTAHGIIGKLGLRGVFKIDFKKDKQTGRYYMLEINARFNLWHQLGAANGVNIPAVAYEYLVNGVRSRPADYQTSCRWLNFTLDYRAYREGDREHKMGFLAWLRSVVFTRKVYRVFSWRDPMPFLSRCLRYFMTKGRSWLSAV